MKNRFVVTLDLTEIELNNLKSFIEFEDSKETDIYFRYETLEKVVKCIFDAKEYEERKERVINSKERCQCGHSESFHSLIGDRLCSAESCPCFKYTKLDTAKA